MKKTLTRLTIACLGLAACATASDAGALTLDVGAPLSNGPITNIAITLTNAGRKPHDRVAVTCVFFDAAGRQLTTSRAYLPATAPGASERVGVMLHRDLGEVASHTCKVG